MNTHDIAASIPDVFAELLQRRGIVGKEAIARFLHPSLADLPHPEKMKNLPEAVELAVSYIKAGKPIVIWGDYDVDGTTSTALLINFFRLYDIEVIWHVPNRFREGYGVNVSWFVDHRADLGGDFLLITVDCGISEADSVRQIQQMGGCVIVTDHHSIADENIPQCLVLNPAQPDCGFAGEALAGVGVAFYFAAGLRAVLAKEPKYKEKSERINLKQFLAFVALGTIADVVPLSQTNRILVRAGLEALLDTPFPGLKALLKSSDIHSGAAVSTEDIGFLLGPKINAAGRLGESRLAIDLFIQRDHKHAEKLTDTLTALNEKRKSICLQSLESALNKSDKVLIERDKCLVVEGELHQGVAGIVASRLVDLFNVPVVVFSRKVEPDGKQYLVGSARSVTGVNVTQCIRECADLTVRFGGHEMAAGLTIPPENYELFCSRFKALVRSALNEDVALKSNSLYDAKIPVETLMSAEYIEFFRLLEPFGPGNILPVFCDPSATIIDSKKVGKSSEHLQVMIRGKYSNHKGIGFRLGEKLHDIQTNPQRKLIYVPTLNRYRGTVSWQIRVIDL